MKEKMNKAWNFVKEHRAEILFASGAIVLGGIIGTALFKNRSVKVLVDNPEIFDEGSRPAKVLPKLGNWKVDDVLRYDNGVIELWLDDLKLDDIGELGEEIVARIPGVPTNAKIWTLMTISEITE